MTVLAQIGTSTPGSSTSSNKGVEARIQITALMTVYSIGVLLATSGWNGWTGILRVGLCTPFSETDGIVTGTIPWLGGGLAFADASYDYASEAGTWKVFTLRTPIIIPINTHIGLIAVDHSGTLQMPICSSASFGVTGNCSLDAGSTPRAWSSNSDTTSPFNGVASSSPSFQLNGELGTDKIQAFTATGAAQTFTVPAGVTTLTVDVCGAQGGPTTNDPKGGRVKCDIAVTPGETLQVNVGTHPTSGANAGWNGGGTGGGNSAGGGGGGATDIRRGSYALADRLVVAPGGGGYAGNNARPAGSYGSGGTPSGQTGLTNDVATGGTGGTASSGGTGGAAFVAGWTGFVTNGTAGSLGIGGNGGDGFSGNGGGGGGGGGFYGGGGGGGNGANGHAAGGGGGGSGKSTGVNETIQDGIKPGDGMITLTWTPVVTKPGRWGTLVHA